MMVTYCNKLKQKDIGRTYSNWKILIFFVCIILTNSWLPLLHTCVGTPIKEYLKCPIILISLCFFFVLWCVNWGTKHKLKGNIEKRGDLLGLTVRSYWPLSMLLIGIVNCHVILTGSLLNHTWFKLWFLWCCTKEGWYFHVRYIKCYQLNWSQSDFVSKSRLWIYVHVNW